MALGMVICGLLPAVFCFGLFFLYLILLAMLAKILPWKNRSNEAKKMKKPSSGDVVDAEFKEK